MNARRLLPCVLLLSALTSTALSAEVEDDADGRHEWLMRQRAYPFDTVPADAAAKAAKDYVAGREAVRRRYMTLLREGAAGSGLRFEALPTGPWTEAGPSPILDDSSRTGFTFGNVAGRVSAVAIHRSRPDVVVIGASRGGLWRSTDEGRSWSPVGDDQVSLSIADVKFAPSNPNVVYAATGDDDVAFWGAGVLKSIDGGLTWTRVDNGTTANGIPNGTSLAKLAVDPVDPDRVVVSGFWQHDLMGSVVNTSIFRTTDGGLTWSRASLPAPGNSSQFKTLVIEESCPSRFWAIDYLGHALIRSLDGGATWTTVTTTGLPAFTLNTKIAVHHESCLGPATLYASVNSGAGLAGSNGYRGVYRSLDDGATWALPGAVPGPSGGCLQQCQRYDHELFVDPTDASRLYMLGRDVWTSTDAGATWINRSGGFDDSNAFFGGRMHVDMHDVAFQRTGAAAVVFIASDGGVWSYETASDTFTNRNGNLAISEFVDLAVHPVLPNRALGGLQDNGGVLFGGSLPWSARVRGDCGASGWLMTAPGSGAPPDGAFTTFIQNDGYLSLDGGLTWTARGVWASAASFNSEVAEFYAPWVETAADNRVWHGAESLWYCDFPNTCAPTWTKKADHLNTLTSSRHTSKIAIHNPSPGVNGPFYVANAFPRGFLQSLDGVAWNVRTAGLPDRYISDIAFDPGAPHEVYVTLQGFGTGHVYRSLDGGTTWEDRSGNLPNVPVRDMLLDPLDPDGTWYIGTDAGVYGTADAGATWSVVGSNLPAVWVSKLEIGPNRILYAATGGRSTWTIPLPGWVAPPSEVAGSEPMLVRREGEAIAISWTENSPAPSHYNIYEGVLGSWYSHAPLSCHMTATSSLSAADSSSGTLATREAASIVASHARDTSSVRPSSPSGLEVRTRIKGPGGTSETTHGVGEVPDDDDAPAGEPSAGVTCTAGMCTALVNPAEDSRYYLLTASGPGSESSAGSGPEWRGPDHVLPPLYTVPQPCGGAPEVGPLALRPASRPAAPSSDRSSERIQDRTSVATP